jgi:hypothetical protein
MPSRSPTDLVWAQAFDLIEQASAFTGNSSA